MKSIHIPVLLLLAGLGMAGCSEKQPAILGKKPGSAPVVSVAQLRPSPAVQTLEGRMIEKCPIAGCWFRLKDATGVMKVDTKDAGFVVVDVPLNTQMRVTGHMALTGEPRFIARGLSYQ